MGTTIFQDKPVVKVDAAVLVVEALQKMHEQKIHHIVVTENEKYLGVFSERNFFENSAKKGSDIMNLPIGNYCSKGSMTIDDKTDLSTALIQLAKAEQTALPILDRSGNITGIVTESDVLKVFNNIFQGEELTLVERGELFLGKNPLAQELISLLNSLGI